MTLDLNKDYPDADAAMSEPGASIPFEALED